MSYKYSLPNKYFEYVKSGIPILISQNLLSIEVEINNNQTGWCINSSVEVLHEFLENINSNDILEAKRKVILADENYNWEKEVKILSNF